MKCHSINPCLWFCLLLNTSAALYLQYSGILLLVGLQLVSFYFEGDILFFQRLAMKFVFYFNKFYSNI